MNFISEVYAQNEVFFWIGGIILVSLWLFIKKLEVDDKKARAKAALYAPDVKPKVKSAYAHHNVRVEKSGAVVIENKPKIAPRGDGSSGGVSLGTVVAAVVVASAIGSISSDDCGDDCGDDWDLD